MTDHSPTAPRVLITGGFGCIGAETARWLLRHTDSRVILCSRRCSEERTHQVFAGMDTSRLIVIQADVQNQECLHAILDQQRISHVVHMAGLQTPDCNAHRDLGLQINLAGTQNLLEAIKASGSSIDRFIFASSMAVYGPRSIYPGDQVPMLAEPKPVNVYGVWKLAGEHIARIFQEDTGIPTISVRPGVLFGPGRDLGLTAAPTTAMKHLVQGTPYEIPFFNRQDYLYAPDVGAAVANALLEPFAGYAAFTLPSTSAVTQTLVQEMRVAANELGLENQFHITIGDAEVPFICDVEYQPFLDTFPKSPRTPLDVAIRQSLETFLQQHADGVLSP